MSQPFKADLHTHSNCSDGSDHPKELVRLAKERGLQGLSITDHDTLEAYTEARIAAQEYDISLLVGIEVSTYFRSESIHVLGYGFAVDSPIMRELCARQLQARVERFDKMQEKLRCMGLDISLEHPHAHYSIGRPHLAFALMAKGYVTSVQEAFDRYLGDGKPAYVQGERVETQEAITLIQSAGGKAILAHPHLIAKKRLLRELLALPFDGIECYYAKMGQERADYFLKVAREKNWIGTGGSDYHGKAKPQLELGCSYVDENVFSQLCCR